MLIPQPYKMVDLDGIDLAEFNGSVYDGVYNKIYDAIGDSDIIILYDWKFADIIIPPSYVTVDTEDGDIIINDVITIRSDDTIWISDLIPLFESLHATENGDYTPSQGYAGFDSVEVEVIPPLQSLEVTENGTYIPEEGYYGFDSVEVEVTPPEPAIEQLVVTENGTYNGEVDGYKPVIVNVPAPAIVNPYIPALYKSLCTAYCSTGGGFYQDNSKTQYLNFYEIEAGDYCVFVSEPVGTRFRSLFFAGKSFSDFEPYIDSVASSPTQIYEATQNITGSTELVGDKLKQRIFFTVSSSGTLIVGTSNSSQTIPSYLFKITS